MISERSRGEDPTAELNLILLLKRLHIGILVPPFACGRYGNESKFGGEALSTQLLLDLVWLCWAPFPRNCASREGKFMTQVFPKASQL